MRNLILRVVLLAIVVTAIAVAVRHRFLHDQDWNLAELRQWIRSWGPLAPLASLGLMVLQALVSPIPFALVVLANGALFGAGAGVLISSAGEVLGAGVAYSLARAGLAKQLARSQLERFRNKLGFWQLVGLRLVPGLSVDLVSYACGALAVPPRVFLWSTGLGLLPRTILLCYFGEELLENPSHTLAVGLTFGFLALLLWARFRGANEKSEKTDGIDPAQVD